ncbi:ABC transporter C family member 3-like [Humulus lupulus]|uniref:ABC transporter C family member 3-like n=1 Tax=Humulus lupulus TaxID=3486 RepID=UPI002B40E019|nr:ABC transporter C family member 3-like [Humulus lupulus]
MELYSSSEQGMLTFFSLYFSFQLYPSTDFFLGPVFQRGISGLAHVLLLFALFLYWVCEKFKVGCLEGPKDRPKNTKSWLYYRHTFICCLSLSAFNLVLCVLSCFYWYNNDWTWTEKRIVLTLLDFSARTLGWGAISVHLHNQYSIFGESNTSWLLKVWWGLYFSVSCYCLVVDIFLYTRHALLPAESIISDVVSVITGLFFMHMGFFKKEEGEDSLLEESLLNGDDGTNVASNDTRGDATVTPYSNAGILSLLSFSWMSPLISLGNKKTLDLEDVPQLDAKDSVFGALPNFKNKLEVVCGGVGNNRVTTLELVKALVFSEWKEIVLTIFFAFINAVATNVGPYLISTFVQYLNGRREFKNEGYILVSMFFVAKIVEIIAGRQFYFKMPQIELRVRAALVAVIYDKGLALSCQSKQENNSGGIINVMTVDVDRVSGSSWSIHNVWNAIVQVSLALFILYKNIGIATVATFLATVLVMLTNVPLGRLEEKFQSNLMESKDTRMKAMSEIMSSMKILKLQGWELKFLTKIVELRKTEEGWLRKYLYTSAMTSFVFWGAPAFISAVTFGTCVLLRIPLETGRILSALATFGILQGPIYSLPGTVSMMVQAKVSLNRIASFLCLDELRSDVIEKLPRGSYDAAVEIVEGNFSWDLSSQSPTLKDIGFKVSHVMKVAVCGTVGSGKSSLLCCILGEMPKISGTVKLCGTKAYVSQSPWIQNGTIEENILFGKEMERERYERVLEACSLTKDLQILSFGDLTIIGEKGINLSGGQKQRIQIARALYQNADIYLFDDSFSAVDAHTGSHLFKECLLGLLSSKTVIYVTHQVEFLPAADLILVMKDGKITQAGKYSDIFCSGTDFMELMGAHNEALSAINLAETGPVEKISIGKIDENLVVENGFTETEEIKGIQDGENGNDVGPRRQLVEEEEREKGRVGLSVYWEYITIAYGGALVPCILLAYILFELFQIGSNYWMTWASPVSENVKPVVGSTTLIMVYSALAIGCSFCILFREMLLVTNGYKIATSLFNKMHLCIFRAPMSFFDANPSGRILNRASTDQSTVDMNIWIIFAFAFSCIQLLGYIAVISKASWQVFIVLVPVIAACIWYQQYYTSSSRELARLEGVCEAPVLQHFVETISGSTTIRCFDQESRFHERNMQLIDAYSRTKFHYSSAADWLGFRTDMLSCVTFAFSLLFLISAPEGLLEPGIAGLAVMYGLSLNIVQNSVVWRFCIMENRIIPVERILQYTRILSEPPLVIESNRPDSSWPSYGEVEIHDLQVRYAPHMPLVLRGITCTFPGGKKTGVVGRTGSGKSTLIQTLFRIVDPAAGQIVIDGIDISSIGLHDLRSKLSIIPQDPTMFEGTVRSNLDPLEEYTDEQIWEALDRCQLGDEVRKNEGKLDSSVSENGENWSMGQRQLVCLGRVLLKKSKILVLDEATASVDTATDNLIQRTLRKHFSNCTVITIAHRITSVIDSDLVLLLNHGLVEEHDSPATLLENKSSSFAQLVAEYSVRSISTSAHN